MRVNTKVRAGWVLRRAVLTLINYAACDVNEQPDTFNMQL